MENLAQRYAYATQIPESAFTIKKLDEMCGHGMHEASGKMSDLPESFSAVDLWDVTNGVWREWINEERLKSAESVQNQIRGEKRIPKPCVCTCHCHSCQSR